MKRTRIPRKLKKALRRITMEMPEPRFYTQIDISGSVNVFATETAYYKIRGSRTRIINLAIHKIKSERERIHKRIIKQMYERSNEHETNIKL